MLFESFTGHRKIALILYKFKNDVFLLHECGFLKNDINRLFVEFKKLLIEQNEEYLNYKKTK